MACWTMTPQAMFPLKDLQFCALICVNVPSLETALVARVSGTMDL